MIVKRSILLDANIPCTGQTRYSGTQNFTGDTYPNGVRLRELRNNVQIQTLNLHNQTNYGNAIDFANTNANWTNGNWAGFAQDQAALDVHWAVEGVLDYWRNMRNRNSIDGNGMTIFNYVHNPVGNNAFWDPTGRVMNYGDGDGITFGPFVALDICAHELGHGIQQYTANMVANSSGHDEADALNEGLSDIWGTCVKNYVAPTKPLWLLGGEILLTNAFNCFRNIQTPKTTTAAEGQHPDTYHGQFWTTNATNFSHFNSTVLSHWFFLICQGGSGTNDNNNTYSVNAIGINRAAQIVYQAETHYLHSGALYADARTAMIQAARDINSGAIGTCDEVAVTNAWFAVGVGAAYVYNYQINGSNSFCTSASYTVTNAPNGSPITWSVDNKSIATVSNSGVVTRVSDGTITLTATVTVCGNTTPIVISKTIHVGNSPIGSCSYSSNCSSNTFNYLNTSLSAVCSAGSSISFTYNITDPQYSNFVWTAVSVPSGASWNSSGGNLLMYVNAPNLQGSNSETVALKANGPCGVYNVNFTSTATYVSGFNVIVVPNPTKDNIKVSVTDDMNMSTNKAIDNSSTSTNIIGVTKISLYNTNSGALIKQWTYQEDKATNYNLNIVGIKAGDYILRMERNNKKASIKVLIK